MPITRDQKKELIKKLETVFKDSKGVVFVGFKGLKVNDANKMRMGFRAQGVEYVVAKKTLMSRALEAAGITGDKPDFAAEVAVAYSADNLTPAREVGGFLKKNKDMLQIIGGIFDGTFITKADVVAYASIPDKKTLYAQVVNLFNSPIQRFVIATSEIAKKKETAAGAAAPAAAPAPAV
ncbi:MAG: 50S ribosomal protein L10 [Patescibacteria group bacterium]|nr:50S ribosomal protein L10 [Patescibacteria group bacterium]MDE2116594.1 50S ribosomal protein L10 [Patescibacteria group bacterium]